jgi:hypothetical protein
MGTKKKNCNNCREFNPKGKHIGFCKEHNKLVKPTQANKCSEYRTEEEPVPETKSTEDKYVKIVIKDGKKTYIKD